MFGWIDQFILISLDTVVGGIRNFAMIRGINDVYPRSVTVTVVLW